MSELSRRLLTLGGFLLVIALFVVETSSVTRAFYFPPPPVPSPCASIGAPNCQPVWSPSAPSPTPSVFPSPTPGPISVSPVTATFSGPTAPPQTFTITQSYYTGAFTVSPTPAALASAGAVSGNSFTLTQNGTPGTGSMLVSGGGGLSTTVPITINATPTPGPIVATPNTFLFAGPTSTPTSAALSETNYSGSWFATPNAVASVSVSGSTLSITPETSGSTTIVVTNSQTQTLSIPVQVNPGGANPVVQVTPFSGPFSLTAAASASGASWEACGDTGSAGVVTNTLCEQKSGATPLPTPVGIGLSGTPPPKFPGQPNIFLPGLSDWNGILNWTDGTPDTTNGGLAYQWAANGNTVGFSLTRPGTANTSTYNTDQIFFNLYCTVPLITVSESASYFTSYSSSLSLTDNHVGTGTGYVLNVQYITGSPSDTVTIGFLNNYATAPCSSSGDYGTIAYRGDVLTVGTAVAIPTSGPTATPWPSPTPVPSPSPTPTPGSNTYTDTPQQADNLVDSIGVVSHIGSSYNSSSQVFNLLPSFLVRMAQSGIRHIRDTIPPSGYAGSGNYAYLVGPIPSPTPTANTTLPPSPWPATGSSLQSYGIKLNYLTSAEYTQSQLNAVTTELNGMIDQYEDPNEPNLAANPDWIPQNLGYANNLASWFPSSTIIAPSITCTPTAAVCGFPNIGGLVTYGNSHGYQSSFNPETIGFGSIGTFGDYGSTYYNTQFPFWYSNPGAVDYTEIGYGTLPTGTQTSQSQIDYFAAVRYYPRIFFEHAQAGVPRTYMYDFMNDGNNGVGYNDFGLLDYYANPKPQYTVLQSMIGLLADPGPTFTPTPLTFTIAGSAGSDANVYHWMMQKRDGSYWLALWLGIPSWDTACGNAGHPACINADIADTSQSITLSSATTLPMPTVYSLVTTGASAYTYAPNTVSNWNGTSGTVAVTNNVEFVQMSTPAPVPSTIATISLTTGNASVFRYDLNLTAQATGAGADWATWGYPGNVAGYVCKASGSACLTSSAHGTISAATLATGGKYALSTDTSIPVVSWTDGWQPSTSATSTYTGTPNAYWLYQTQVGSTLSFTTTGSASSSATKTVFLLADNFCAASTLSVTASDASFQNVPVTNTQYSTNLATNNFGIYDIQYNTLSPSTVVTFTINPTNVTTNCNGTAGNVGIRAAWSVPTAAPVPTPTPVATPTPQAALDPAVPANWFTQKVCVDVNNGTVSVDPYTASVPYGATCGTNTARPLQGSDTVPYYHWTRQLATCTTPVCQWFAYTYQSVNATGQPIFIMVRELTPQVGGPPSNWYVNPHYYPGETHYDTYQIVNNIASTVATRDTSGFEQIFFGNTAGASTPFNGWVTAPTSFFPAPAPTGTAFYPISGDYWETGGIPVPVASFTPVPTATGTQTTWYETNFTFDSGKTMTALVSQHQSAPQPADTNPDDGHMEIWYYTVPYGPTRWEEWSASSCLGNTCAVPPPPRCAAISPQPRTFTYQGGAYSYWMTDCADYSWSTLADPGATVPNVPSHEANLMLNPHFSNDATGTTSGASSWAPGGNLTMDQLASTYAADTRNGVDAGTRYFQASCTTTCNSSSTLYQDLPVSDFTIPLTFGATARVETATGGFNVTLEQITAGSVIGGTAVTFSNTLTTTGDGQACAPVVSVVSCASYTGGAYTIPLNGSADHLRFVWQPTTTGITYDVDETYIGNEYGATPGPTPTPAPTPTPTISMTHVLVDWNEPGNITANGCCSGATAAPYASWAGYGRPSDISAGMSAYNYLDPNEAYNNAVGTAYSDVCWLSTSGGLAGQTLGGTNCPSNGTNNGALALSSGAYVGGSGRVASDPLHSPFFANHVADVYTNCGCGSDFSPPSAATAQFFDDTGVQYGNAIPSDFNWTTYTAAWASAYQANGQPFLINGLISAAFSNYGGSSQSSGADAGGGSSLFGGNGLDVSPILTGAALSMGAMWEGCYGGSGYGLTNASYGIAQDWGDMENYELWMAAHSKLMWCRSLDASAASSAFQHRLFQYASFLLTFDPTYSMYGTSFTTSSLWVMPETRFVPTSPLGTLPTRVSALEVGTSCNATTPNCSFGRQYTACYQNGSYIGSCAVEVNPTTGTLAAPYTSGYNETLVLSGSGVLDGGAATVTANTPPPTLGSEVGVILVNGSPTAPPTATPTPTPTPFPAAVYANPTPGTAYPYAVTLPTPAAFTLMAQIQCPANASNGQTILSLTNSWDLDAGQCNSVYGGTQVTNPLTSSGAHIYMATGAQPAPTYQLNTNQVYLIAATNNGAQVTWYTCTYPTVACTASTSVATGAIPYSGQVGHIGSASDLSRVMPSGGYIWNVLIYPAAMTSAQVTTYATSVAVANPYPTPTPTSTPSGQSVPNNLHQLFASTSPINTKFVNWPQGYTVIQTGVSAAIWSMMNWGAASQINNFTSVVYSSSLGDSTVSTLLTGYGGAPASGKTLHFDDSVIIECSYDKHAMIADPKQGYTIETETTVLNSNCTPNISSGQLSFGLGGIFYFGATGVNGNYAGYPSTSNSSGIAGGWSAVGTAILGNELLQGAGGIQHAITLDVPCLNYLANGNPTFPSDRTLNSSQVCGGSLAGNVHPYYGDILVYTGQTDAQIASSSRSNACKAVLTALHDYGGWMGDTGDGGGQFYIQAEASYGGSQGEMGPDPFPAVLAGITSAGDGAGTGYWYSCMNGLTASNFNIIELTHP